MPGRAGVFVSEANFLSFQTPPTGAAVAAFIGSHYRGPVNIATFISSWPSFVQNFGGFDGVTPPSNLQLAVYTFFQNGGTGCWCVRATGTSTQASSANLVDASPTNTITISAKNPGVWGNNLSIAVQAGAPVPLPPTTVTTTSGAAPQTLPPSGGVFTVISTTGFATASSQNPQTFQVATTSNGIQTVQYTGTTSTTFTGCTLGTGSAPAGAAVTQVQNPTIASFNLLVYFQGTTAASLVETWNGLTMSPSNSQYFLTILNSATSGSNWISAALATGSPGTLPVAIPLVSLQGGADGAAIGTGGYTTANAANGQAPNGFLNALDVVTASPLLLNLPNVTVSGVSPTATDINNAIGYAANRQDTFVIVDPPPTSAVTGAGNPYLSTTSSGAVAVLTGANVSGVIGAASAGLSVDPMSYSAMFVPWLNISDPTNNSPGATRYVPPGGFVCGEILKTDTVRGVFKAPAGLQTVLSAAVGLEWKFTLSDLDNLYSGNAGSASPSPSLNPIRLIPGTGLVIWGSRTLSTNPVVRPLPVRRTLIYIRNQLLALAQFAVFEPNDGILWNNLSSVFSQFLGGFWQSGGLKGTSVAEAYYVTIDATNNTPTTIQNGEVHIDVGVAVQRPAEFIIIRLGQWQGVQQATILS